MNVFLGAQIGRQNQHVPRISIRELESSQTFMPSKVAPFQPSIAPWISVPDGSKAIDFFKSAFEAKEVYRFEDPSGGLVVRLSVSSSEFWLSQESPERLKPNPEPVGGGSIRMILMVTDPDVVFARALKAGATEVFPVGEGHGWRLGRLVDPFGLHWEIGHPLSE
jgi:PhnB protein